MSTLRSFTVRGNRAMPREGNFTARVSEFLGIAPCPDGFIILTLCDEKPRAPFSILVPAGLHSVDPGAPRWDFFVRVDGEEPPLLRKVRNPETGHTGTMGCRFLGGVAIGDGVAFVFVMPHEAPEGAEFVE